VVGVVVAVAGHQVARDRGRDGAEEANAKEHQGHGGDTALGGDRGDVAVADDGQGDDAPPERVERIVDRLVDAVLGDVEPGRTRH
jgi:hypothetical protein